ncbi:MAG: VWA domain-containing protein [Archangiaceae bacterium]|nr:VWA domain-containing protein [Archangiaceae bacterium]
MAKPRVYPVEILPPTIDRSNTGQVRVVPPPNIDAVQVDVLKQSDGIVDILWVIDDSGSMANQRKTLNRNFEGFLAKLRELKVDYQIGVTSTNFTDNGKLRGAPKIITNLTADAGFVFEKNTTFPSSRTRWEQGLRMAQFAVSSPNIDGGNAGFLRPNAALAIIVVSDEDDSSFGTPDYFARAFQASKGKGNESLVSFSTIAGTTPVGCTPAGEENFYGSLADPAFRYAAVSTKTGGIVGSICDASFENTLIQIAEALNTLRRVFPLTLSPVGGTLTVTVNGMVVPQDPVNGWQYREDTKSVVFLGTYVPPPGAEVKLEYAFSK